ncbi:MAG: ABC transporter permease [Spirosomataceae bacterium]
MKFLRLTLESFRFAWQALRSNILRTALSLLGVTVGIFAIIAVLTMVDSLNRNIRQSLDFIGNQVVYVQKWPWFFGNGTFAWWEYFRRPNTKFSEFKYLEKNLESSQAICAMDFKGGTTVKNGNNSFEALIQGITLGYNQISEVPIANGRYFVSQEIDAARNVAVLGDEVASSLFPNLDPVGREFKLSGQKFLCVGVQERKGESLLDFGGNPDIKILIPFPTFARLYQGGNPDIDIAIKGFPDDTNLEQLTSEITGLMRARRGLKPTAKDNFAINKVEAAADAIQSLFGVLNLAGWIIGSFSMLVGGFGIANIMFVSVKERTNIIGIQKSLGAKNYFILFQFLFEAVFLSLIGGLVGIFLVYLLSFVNLGSLDIVLSAQNIMIGLGVASFIGLLSGIIPAMMASNLDPVIAIRSK